jgi:hypothetical protein
MNPFQNPLTRNRQFPTIQFAQSEEERKNLHTPASTYSYEDAVNAYNNLHVPQQEPRIDALAGFNFDEGKDAPPGEWRKPRTINHFGDVRKDWGDPIGKLEDDPQKEELDPVSKEYAKNVGEINAKLSADAQTDELRKQLLADIDAGKIISKTKLIDESKKNK